MDSVFGYEYQLAAHLLVTDEDAADFLQSQFSNELRPFEAGRCTYGLWLDVKGRVVADGYILCEGPERFRILSEFSPAAVIAEKLECHIIADDVVVETLPACAALSLVGAGSGAVLFALGIEPPHAGTFSRGAGASIFAGRRSLQPSFELLFESQSDAAAFKARLVGQSVAIVSAGRIQEERLAAGIPSIPIEIGPADLPGEGGLIEDAVSLTKGCYLGQEVVARMHNLGRPQRGLFRLRGSGEAPVCPIALYNGESKKVGELRSAFSQGSAWLGVALLKTRFADVGEVLHFDGRTAQVQSRFIEVGKGAES
jgi:folate-binding protein YgfZ